VEYLYHKEKLMNKEPIALYVFRFIMGLGLFAFMGMLYWSSLLIEKDIKSLRRTVNKLTDETNAIRMEGQEVRLDVLEAILEDQENRQELLKGIYHNKSEIRALKRGGVTSTYFDDDEEETITLKTTDPLLRRREHIDTKLPNLMREDPFYEKTLPQLLGNSFQPKGSLRMASIGKPENLHPFNGFRSVSNMINLCSH
jgi:peptide/nickel transport system substrate-binding protein